ncbi:Starch-binding associating with outer membrane [Chitinophaga terrae (ex Kim and Jung 2007)]|uniref:Starch-binding associating with outer membrane n=1 Tax=Chitinophaga terrae (ex Kim and Jung 2007) TaxID=408074 RepID=A0A1H4GGA5_9BACT|nr:RagB/SusD family nutrient uptake outer membrane protein [Chitinophaga terrae (ex Kim and Jung 2007)]GEP93425.1 membrane protein [Chitinophaga terrae (ex Kim and Jung 2007)]SEB08517.1 Starch-binding associating with outer membrane [Chitinophaga terrae (ex Kim and Jung 2007)]
MKNILKIAGVIFFLVTSQSCKKWVDYSPHDDFQVTDLDYLKSESDYRTMVISCYSPLQWLNQAVPIGDIASDNSVTGGESASDVLGLQQIDDFTHSPNNDYLTEIWKSAYEGINRVNYLTQFKDKNPAGTAISFTGKDALYGEIYFLRAYYYWTLVRFFGDVPLFVDRRLTLADSKTLTRTAAADVYKQIEADLNSAIGVLPTAPYQPGRVTKYAAQALLGKVLIYQNKFDAAATMLENVIAGPFTLVPEFGDIFLQSGENGPESVFEIQYSNLSPYYNWGGATRGQGNYAVQQCGIRGLNGSSPYAAGWSTNLPSADLAKAYQAGDQRKDVTVLDIEAYKAAHPEYGITYQVAPYKNTGLYNQKYLPRKGETSGQLELNYLNNYRTIRFAEVLLLAAEAYNRSSTPNDAKAQTYLNRVRQRAFKDNLHNITLTGSALTNAIWNERRLELAMEGDRFFDLVRTGKAASVLPKFQANKHELFPIPQQEVEISGLKQNPNY